LTAAVTKIGMSADIQPIVKWTISRTPEASESGAEITIQNATDAKATSATAAAPTKDKVKK
jgi:hypothetical protein